MDAYAEKRIEAEAESRANSKLNGMLPEIKKTEHAEAVKEVRAEYSLAEGRKIYSLSPFCCETITVNGEELYPNSFIPDQCQQLKRYGHLPRIKNQIEYLGQNTLR